MLLTHKLNPLVFLTGANDLEQARRIIAVEEGLMQRPDLRHLTVIPTKEQQEAHINRTLKEMDDETPAA